jgi:hypothetical protein
MTEWKIALRSLIRRPSFSITVIGLLILGVGANTALFALVDTVLLKALPYPEAGQLVSVYEASPAKGEQQSLIAPGRLDDWNRLNTTFSAIAGSYAIPAARNRRDCRAAASLPDTSTSSGHRRSLAARSLRKKKSPVADLPQ